MNIFNEIKATLQEYLNNKQIKNTEIILEEPNKLEYGNLYTNLALMISKKLKDNSINIAEDIKRWLLAKKNTYILKIDIVKPGFINIFLNNYSLFNMIKTINNNEKFGKKATKNFKYNLEVVSANPTGNLHVGHARNGIIGDSVRRILKYNGFNVYTEYYLNDAGVQINLLALTVFYNYLNMFDIDVVTNDNLYKGIEYKKIAEQIYNKYQDDFVKTKYSDKEILNTKVNNIFKEIALNHFLKSIKNQLNIMKIHVDYFISEKKIYESGIINKMLKHYEKTDASYWKDGALWLKTTEFKDDKDRVLIKKDGTYTYITPDLASHHLKIIKTKPDKIIDFWGGDHHGYIKRMQCGLDLYGHQENILEVDIIQMVRVIKDNKEFKMSKRKGTAIWVTDLVEMIGYDALRFMLCSKSNNTHMDLDIDLLSSKTSKNPIFYIQYACSRIMKILKRAEIEKIHYQNIETFNYIENESEQKLIQKLLLFTKTLENAANTRSPHLICDYLYNITKLFHNYYHQYKIIDNNKELTLGRLYLINAIFTILKIGLSLLGIEAKEEM